MQCVQVLFNCFKAVIFFLVKVYFSNGKIGRVRFVNGKTILLKWQSLLLILITFLKRQSILLEWQSSSLVLCTISWKFSFTDLSPKIVNGFCILKHEGSFAGKEAEAVPLHQALVAGSIANNVS